MYKIYTGTSGYSYQDWRDNFYPVSLNPGQYLRYYSSYFNTVELNFSYYRFPETRMLETMCKNLAERDDFVFSLKANSIFTHERNYSGEDVRIFLENLKPLMENNRMGSLLFQFPYSFYYNGKNMDFLCSLLEKFENIEKSAEFRNIDWLNDKTTDCLKNSNTGFCNVDEPSLKGLLPITEIETSENGYIRFHGRNSQNWWKPQKAYQRYDYMYNQEELAEWMPRVKKLSEKAKKIYVYFNNHYKGKAVKSASMFLELLKSHSI